jgi:uncharacterized protein involved in outer membrane biogenesis
MKRPLRLLGIAAASLLVLVVGGSFAIYHLIDFGGLVTEKVREQTPALREALGRDVELGPIRTHFFPTLGVRLDGVKVAAREAGGAPLLEVERISVDVALWKALLSLGKKLEIVDVTLDGPALHVVRHADGTLSVDDLLASGEEAQPEGEPASLPQGLHIRQVLVRGGSITLRDLGAETTAQVQHLALRVRDLSADRPVAVELSLAALSDQPNFSFSVEAGPLGALPPEGLPSLRNLRLTANDVDLGALAPFFGPWGEQLEAARLSAALQVPALAPSAPLDAKGFLALSPLRLAGGEPLDARVDVDVRVDPQGGAASLRALAVDLGGMRLVGAGEIRALRTDPRFEGLDVRTEGWDLGKLLRHVPQLRRALPEGSRLAGPVHLAVQGEGSSAAQELQGELRLTDAEIHVPGTLSKPAGVPLAVAVDARLADGGATLRKLLLSAADLRLEVQGEAKSLQPLRYDLQVQAAPFDLDGLFRLAPSVQVALDQAGARAGGSGTIAGHLRGDDRRLDVALDASLLGAALDVPQAKVQGDVSLRLRAQGDPAGDLEAGLVLDAGQARVQVDGLLDKAPQTPLAMNVQGERRGETLRFSHFDVRLGPARLEAEGALGPSGATLELRLPRVELDALTQTFPWLPEPLHLGGHLVGAARLQGDPSKPSSIQVSIPSFEGRIGASDFRLTASLQNLEAPSVEGALHANFLDLDALRGAPATDEAAQAREPAEDRPALRAVRAQASIDLRRVRLTGRDLSDVVGKVRLRDGVLEVEEARFGIYGGKVSAAGSQAEVWKGNTPFSVHLEAKDLDVERAMAAETGKRSLLAGKGNLDLHLEGTGTERVDLEKHLQGSWSLSMLEGRVVGPDLRHSILESFAVVPSLQPSRLSTERAIRDLVGTFVVSDGKMHLEKPLSLSLGGGKLTLGGAVGIFGDLFLDGSYLLPAADLQRLSGGRCKADEPLPIPVRLSGTPSSPSVRSDGSVAMALAKTCLAGAAEGAVDALLGTGATQKAREQVDAAKQAAEQKVDQVKEAARQAELEAKREADRRAEQLRQEAERAKREAEERAKQKAKEAAGGMKKRLGL